MRNVIKAVIVALTHDFVNGCPTLAILLPSGKSGIGADVMLCVTREVENA